MANKHEGQRFGKLVVLAVHHERSSGGGYVPYSSVRCDCGVVYTVRLSRLLEGVKQCSTCRAAERKRAAEIGHKHPLYRVWAGMISRCYVPTCANYRNYGARGITVCDRWRGSAKTGDVVGFRNFVEDMGERPEGLTLERVDNNAGYSKENCRWATMEDQANNTRSNVVVEHNGVRRTITQWTKEFDLPTTWAPTARAWGVPLETALELLVNQGRTARVSWEKLFAEVGTPPKRERVVRQRNLVSMADLKVELDSWDAMLC